MAIVPSVFTAPTFVTGASVTGSLEIPGAWLYQYIVVPTMSAGYSAASTPIYLQCSADGTTFYRFTNTDNTTATLVAGSNDFIIGSQVSQRVVMIPNLAVRYIKFEVSGTCTTPASAPPFKIICVSNQ